MAPKSDKYAHLLVEGPDDQHVVWALCTRYNVPETFDVIVPSDGGIDAVRRDIPVRLKESGLTALGILVDADENLQSRWESLRNLLENNEYQIPVTLPLDGLIVAPPDRPRIGLWLMPDNQEPGMLENFVAQLIPAEDPLKPIAEQALDDIETQRLNRYNPVHRPKALIHTWLAWQNPPGRPIGQSITNHVLRHNQPLANRFVTWMQNLFN